MRASETHRAIWSILLRTCHLKKPYHGKHLRHDHESVTATAENRCQELFEEEGSDSPHYYESSVTRT